MAAKKRSVSRSGYRSYIRSKAWAEVKKRYRASNLPQRCYVCGEKKVDLHHKTYKRLGNERLTDLMPLCREHHQMVHLLVEVSENKSKVNLWTAAKRIERKLKY